MTYSSLSISIVFADVSTTIYLRIIAKPQSCSKIWNGSLVLCNPGGFQCGRKLTDLVSPFRLAPSQSIHFNLLIPLLTSSSSSSYSASTSSSSSFSSSSSSSTSYSSFYSSTPPPLFLPLLLFLCCSFLPATSRSQLHCLIPVFVIKLHNISVLFFT